MNRPSVPEAAEVLAEMTGGGCVVNEGSDSSADAAYRICSGLTVYPRNEEEVANVLKWANENGYRVAPQGGGTKDALGQAVTDPDLIISMQKINGIVQHSAGDLIVTAYAGTTIAQLQQTLARAGQVLPIDPGHEEQTTLGGLVAANTSGLKRGMYGSIRDYLIATRVVYPDGRRLRTGAKVVKNVAGYDMNKLFVGSMGTLGILTEVTVKVRPLPQSTGCALLQADNLEHIQKLQAALLDTQLEPCVFELTDRLPDEFDAGKAYVVVTFEDVLPSVRYQLEQLRQIASTCGVQVLDSSDGDEGKEMAEKVLGAIRKRWPTPDHVVPASTVVALKLSSLLADVPALYDKVRLAAEECGLEATFNGGLSSGISRAIVTVHNEERVGNEHHDEALKQWIMKTQSLLEECGGHAVVEFAPKRLKSSIAVWGKDRPDMVLMRGIKNKIDPQGTLNPGRFVGGI